MQNKRKQILLTWDAFNNGFVVTAKMMEQLYKEHTIKIDTLYYLQNQELSKNNLDEINVFFEREGFHEFIKKTTDNRVKERLRECHRITDYLDLEKYTLPGYKNKNIPIKNVTHYQSIYDGLIKFIKDFLFDENKFDLHINISPGTPQMHVVWLMLNAAGYLPVNTFLWSSQYHKKTNKTVLEKVNFKPNTLLSETLNKKYLNTGSPTINPNDTVSEKRKFAEEQLITFSHIPNAPILLLGERGVGKSTYVRTLIKGADSEDLPYIELACGTFSEDLLRSELFGYVKGAFTGADKDKKGILSEFDEKGILFLDEIQDLSKALQRQLVQVLQTGEYYPLGSLQAKKATFRLVIASNNSFEQLAQKLDLDFLDRTTRFIVEIPAIRECLEDLKLYWENVWKEIANFEDAPICIWHPKIEKFLRKEPLPGNFRDLQKLASYIMAYTLAKNPEAIDKAIAEFSKWRIINKSNTYFEHGKNYNEMVANFNKDLALWAIKTYDNKKKAASILERSESSLTKDIKQERLKTDTRCSKNTTQ